MSDVKGFAGVKWAENVANRVAQGIDPEGHVYKYGERRCVRYDDYISALPAGVCIQKEAVTYLINRALRFK